MGAKSPSSTILFFHSQQRDRGPAEEKLRGIYRFARASGWKIVVLEAPTSKGEVRGKICTWQPRGCIVDMNESSKYFTADSLCSTPTVFLDFDSRQARGMTFRVNHDPDAIGALAAKHLQGLGLDNFAFVGYSREWSWSNARKLSFASHLGIAGTRLSSFEFPVETVVPQTVKRRFVQWMSRLDLPCGLLLADDGLAGEVYPVCANLGLNIPQDIAVLGIDDNERLCGNLNPPMSSILLDFSQAGWKAAELLYRVIENPAMNPFVSTYNPLGISPRGSTALKIARENPIANRAGRLVEQFAASGANVAEIASHFKCSRRLVELRFRQSTGHSLLDAIHAARLNTAIELLRSKVAIGDIPSLCGYSSESALKSLFKRRFGKTMSEWRKNWLSHKQ